jgi:heme oxygenase (biliverdin-producing, ferredoxin)
MSLKELTAAAHNEAETQPFVKLIFSGDISKEDYTKFLFNQYAAYSTLESLADTAGLLTDLLDIKRADKINEDIHELGCPLPEELLPSTLAYIEHLVSIKDEPQKLLSHIYVRHMGDLYGGQMIAKKVPGSGQFYKFEDADALKTALRAKLDDSLADEALKCFSFATNIFEDMMK